jgi:hypothetical protein
VEIGTYCGSVGLPRWPLVRQSEGIVYTIFRMEETERAFWWYRSNLSRSQCKITKTLAHTSIAKELSAIVEYVKHSLLLCAHQAQPRRVMLMLDIHKDQPNPVFVLLHNCARSFILKTQSKPNSPQKETTNQPPELYTHMILTVFLEHPS